MLTDDESSRDELPKLRSRERGQSSVPNAAKGTKTQSGETFIRDYLYYYLMCTHAEAKPSARDKSIQRGKRGPTTRSSELPNVRIVWYTSDYNI